ncbi:hypothetical protein [Allosphingosinicella sp.]|jgi:hypothetical protein|uniref:hypothetical protein n=1 Tax=Allosphingosinicella sp. TaxID=2823234 RepID=UPI002F238DB2
MKLSYTAAWQETLALVRAHGSTIAAVTGVFLFLPALLTGYLLPRPEAQDWDGLVRALRDYAAASWPWLLLEGLFNMVGVIAILRLVFPRGASTVGGVIASAFLLVPTYFVANFLTSVMFVVGLLLLIVPAIYLIGRIAILAPVIVAENRTNPIAAIGRSFELTRGNGWAVAGLVILVAIAAAIVAGVANAILGILFLLVAGEDLGRFLVLIVSSATGAAFAALMTLLYAGIYRRLSAGSSDAAAVFADD